MDARVEFTSGATPVQRADRLAAAIGMRPGALWIKRDDLTGLAGGGNKARKLEYLCADAQAAGHTLLVTGGGPQSNHARATAAAAAYLGLGCHLVLAGDPPAQASGNLVLDRLLGATVEWTTGPLEDAIAAATAARGGYLVPFGGSSPLGALGYVRAADELRAQVPDVRLVVTATGSAGTHAGLAAGFGDWGLVGGVRVTEFADLRDRVRRLAGEAAALAGRPAPAGELVLDERHLGGGYGVPTREALAAIGLTARTTGLILDPVYTGKAMAALAAGVRDGELDPEATTVFLHTGGLPGVFAERYAPLW
ncbi:pyridoxal-phosphate dependent enzyme [Longispora fulva]|uniref:D-cysteine desulfhydrase n=1 Tax=Longispora fulva TaxID=619741 RepID=A0A8J7KGZ2_9ACTN|nr:pyridoxal-phosphate dependent enzyme [Longispora fulva]MBG6137895.1 D-cysteine desulfhydrase [Longispora fulva]